MVKYRIEAVIKYRAYITVTGNSLEDCKDKAWNTDDPESWTPMDVVQMTDPDGERCVKLSGGKKNGD